MNSRQHDLEMELSRIVDILKSDASVKSIIVFGSLSKGEFWRGSDIDLIVIKNTNMRFLDRLDELYTRILPRMSLDLFVYTPDEFVLLQENNSFVKRAIKEGKVLYET